MLFPIICCVDSRRGSIPLGGGFASRLASAAVGESPDDYLRAFFAATCLSVTPGAQGLHPRIATYSHRHTVGTHLS